MKRRKSRTTRNTVPAWVLRDDPLFSNVTGAKLHVNCKCKDCRKRA